MRALKCSIFLFILSLVLPASVFGQRSGTHQSVGLVLSGGGAKGIAHIGAIQALEDNDIPIDYITGTSMGAIVGGLYACGYTPAEMMQLIESNYFSYMSTGRIDPAFTYYFSCEQPSSQMFSVPVGNRDSVDTKRFNPQSLVSPMPMIFGFMEIFSAYTAQCHEDFNRLFVPFRCVSSDMTKRRKAVFSHGDLAESIRASMSFPLIFQAVKMDDNVYYDGGIYDNFPVDVMRSDFGPDVMIGFDVSTPTEGPQNSYMDQLEMLVMNPQTYDLPESEGVKVRINLSDFSLLDFGAAKAIYQRGYDRTMAMIDSIKGRVHSRMPARVRDVKRGMFKSATPALCFSDVTVSGGTRRQNEYLEYLFKPASGTDTIGIDRARRAFYRAIGSEKLSRFVPKATIASDTTGLFNLHFDATIKSKFDVGAGAFITSSNNSYLYCRAGYSSMSFSTINTNIEAWIGQSYMAGALNAAMYMHSSVPSAFKLLAVASRRRYYESEKLFFRDNEPSFVVNHDYFGRLGWTTAAGRTGAIEIGVGGGQVYNSFFRNSNADSYTAGRDKIKLNLGQLYATYSSATLNNANYPTSGYSRNGRIMALLGRSHYKAAIPLDGKTELSDKRRWLQFDWKEKDYFDISKAFSLGVEGQAVLSTRSLFDSYYGAISTAPAFVPTQAAGNVFDPELRANSFFAASVVPIYKYNSSLSARLSLNGFVPVRTICDTPEGTARYGNWFGTAHFFGELDIVYSLHIADICAYCNYSSTRSKFSAGISFGFYLPAPSFL